MQASDIRRGTVIMFNGAPHRVMEFQHSTPGNLRAKVQTKLRNLLTGSQTEARFSATEAVPEADVATYPASYMYSDGEQYHFMQTSSYEEITLTADTLGDAIYYLQEQMEVNITLWEGNPIGVSLPSTVVLTIVDTEPELRGATASNSPKPAKTDTGLSLTVPPFIAIGEEVVVNTVEGKYVSRASE
jgi:elongation factor P